ncbi:MAG TPA: DUF3298 domain-containing protein [Rhizomicrobium sp.]|jgi:uncharacterized protein YecT (DUF1311 family)
MKIAGVVAGFALLATAAQAQVKITPKLIHASQGEREIKVRYPKTGNAAVDKVLTGFAKATASYVDFSQPADEDNAHDVRMDFRVLRNDAQMLTVALDSSIYYGGAHPMPNGVSFTFLMPDGWRVFLPELVDGQRAMNRISDLAKEQIRREAAKEATLNQDLMHDIDTGAGPHSLNDTAFVWKPDELVLSFGSYEMFGYPGGPDVHIPMAKLADVVRANPRAPQPSFNCLRAHASIEKALCNNVELARQDRALADQYADAIARQRYYLTRYPKNAAREQDALDKLIAGQKSWQGERDRQCANGEATCLAASYKTRLEEARRF